jgi:hypothetical protein
MYEVNFIMDQYGWKSDLANNTGGSLLYGTLTNSVKYYTRYTKSPFMRMRNLVSFFVNNMTSNWNYKANHSQHFIRQI